MAVLQSDAASSFGDARQCETPSCQRVSGLMALCEGHLGLQKGVCPHTVNTKVTKPWEDPASRDFRSPTCACFGARLRMVELTVPTARADLHQPDERNTLWYSIIRFLPVTRYSTTPYSSRQGRGEWAPTTVGHWWCVADLASLPAFGDLYRVLATELGFEGHMG